MPFSFSLPKLFVYSPRLPLFLHFVFNFLRPTVFFRALKDEPRISYTTRWFRQRHLVKKIWLASPIHLPVGFEYMNFELRLVKDECNQGYRVPARKRWNRRNIGHDIFFRGAFHSSKRASYLLFLPHMAQPWNLFLFLPSLYIKGTQSASLVVAQAHLCVVSFLNEVHDFYFVLELLRTRFLSWRWLQYNDVISRAENDSINAQNPTKTTHQWHEWRVKGIIRQ